MTKTKEKPMLHPNLLENHLYSTFVLPQMIEQNAMIHDTEVEVHHEIILSINAIIHKIDIVLHLEIGLIMTKVLLFHTTLDHDMTTTKKIGNLIALLMDPHTYHLIDVPLVTDIDHAHIQEITLILQDMHLLLDHLLDPEILDFLDLAHIPIQETNFVQFNHKPKMTQLSLKYICITPLKWQSL